MMGMILINKSKMKLIKKGRYQTGLFLYYNIYFYLLDIAASTEAESLL